ncbi:MAG: hypothetical protein ACREJ3_15600, partial [Polyangiaceae bacterium]
AEPSGLDGPRSILAQAARFLGARVALRVLTGFGPLGALWPLRGALRTYVLGHLFDRYLELGRTERAALIEVNEAKRVRLAIENALIRSVTVAAPPEQSARATRDLREPATGLVDALLVGVAGIPEWLLRRLDAAFDDLLIYADG